MTLPEFTATDTEARPVFILGAGRSGTTAMLRGLRASGGFESCNEGHLLALVARIETVITTHYARQRRDAAPGKQTLIAQVPPLLLRDAMQSGFVAILRAQFPTGRWIDKTPGPEMIRAAPVLRRIWPRARFLLMRRRGVDNIESRRRKFAAVGFAEHCRLWSDSMLAWLEVRDALGGAALEIDQAWLATAPREVAQAVAPHLGLDVAAALRLGAALRAGRPQRTSIDPAAAADLEVLDWTEQERAQFVAICGDACRSYGYEADLAIAARPTARPNLRNPATC